MYCTVLYRYALSDAGTKLNHSHSSLRMLESAVAVLGSQAETSEAAKRGEGGAGKDEAMPFLLGETS
jgi:hypothetical protein